MDRHDMLRIMQESGALSELDINDEDFLGGHGREESHVKVMEAAYALGLGDRETWAVVYGNYEPAEVDSTWPTEGQARSREAELDREAGAAGTMWRTVKW